MMTMLNIGQFNTLLVLKEVAFGFYLDGEEWGEILLPRKSAPPNLQVGDKVNVFIYFDSEGKIIATTTKPYAQVGHFAFLKVIDVNPVGAFLDWGLEKDLLVPRAEQRRPMEQDKSYLVYLTLDRADRIIASSKIDYYLDKSPPPFQKGEEVHLLVAERTDLGTKVIINNSHWGLIHSSDLFKTLRYGQEIQGYIKTVREDGKVDVVLRKVGQESVDELATRIVQELQKRGGFLPLHDKSSAHEIQLTFNESKKRFKNAIGNLYKRGEIIIEENGIRIPDKK